MKHTYQSVLLAALVVGLGACSAQSKQATAPPSAPVAATDQSPVAQSIQDALLAADPSVLISRIRTTPVAGLYEVMMTTPAGGDQLVYVSADGSLLIEGEMIDLNRQASLTLEAVMDRRVEVVRNTASTGSATYLADNPTQTIYAFTDSSCPACLEFHEAIPDINAAGVSVEYLAFPRGGEEGEGFAEMTGVWCSEDRSAALDLAFSGQEVAPDATCVGAVRDQYEVGLRLGVAGTPTFITENGMQYPGFPGTKELLAALNLAPANDAATQEDEPVEG